MTIKSRLRISFSVLFVILLLLGGLAVWYINQLSKASDEILKDNYATLKYAEAILQGLGDDDQQMNARTSAVFEKALRGQEANVSEVDEKEATAQIRSEFTLLKQGNLSADALADNKQHIRKLVYRVMDLNMQAIARKNDDAAQSARNATLIMALLAVACFLGALTFTVNFPGYLTRSLAQLNTGLRDLLARKYDLRIDNEHADELGELAVSYNALAKNLGENSSAQNVEAGFDRLRIDTLISNLNDAVIGLDQHQVILFANPVALDLLGLQNEQIIGKNIHELALRNDVLRELLNNPDKSELSIAGAEKETAYSKHVLPLAVKESLSAQTENTLIRSDKSIGSLILLRSITRSQKLDEARNQFVAGISEVLKEPVSAIQGGLKDLENPKSGALTDTQRNLIENIRADSDRLSKISTELLDMARVETGNVQMNFSATKAAEVVNYAADAIRIAANERGIQIHVDLQPGLPDVQADQEKTAWVLVNFLSNAVRYSPERSSIDVQVKRGGKDIEFSVRDYGKGIDEKYRSRIFDRYFQVPTDSGQAKSGTGLGLAIAKDFISAQGGRIWVESEPGEGSKFCFALPAVG